jgi:cobalt-zinc-cadmium efflux system outer membrane protein
MRTYVFPIAVLCLASVAPAAQAQQAGVPAQLALDEAWRLARANNPLLAAERQMVEMAQADRLGAALRPNPAVTVESEGYPLFDAPRPAFVNGQEFTLRFDQEIELAGRRRLRTETAEAAVAVARAFLADAERRRLRLEVQRAYQARGRINQPPAATVGAFSLHAARGGVVAALGSEGLAAGAGTPPAVAALYAAAAPT